MVCYLQNINTGDLVFRVLFCILCAAWLGACNGDVPEPLADLASLDMAARGRCPACAPPVMLPEISDPALIEASGLAASVAHPGAFWSHNDSGDGPRLFLIDAMGATLAQYTVTNATAVDWEDMGIGPCGPDTCLFVADLGDNSENRGNYVIYKIVEPTVFGGTLTAERMAVHYSDGSHNCEALFVHPVSGALTVVTKTTSGASGIYELVGDTFIRAGDYTPPSGATLVTGGSTRAGAVLLRTYTHVFYYPLEPGKTVAQALADEPCMVPSADETQGESIAGTPTGFFTLSEGKNVPLNKVDCD
jgi:hypothetical protein